MTNWNTIDRYILGRSNNYLLIRFVAASLVIFSHSYHLSGNFDNEPLLRLLQFIDFSAIAVAIFFVVSGFLISQSFDARRNLFAFLEARVLRIFPGLILTVLFMVFIVGAWATTLPLADYLKNPETIHYIFNNILLNTQYTLPGVFHNTPFPDGVNGALWTLRLEFSMYLMVAALGVSGLLKSRLLLNLVVSFCFIAILLNPSKLFFIPAEWALPHLKLFGCFVLGLIAYVNRSFIPLNFTIAASLIALTLAGHNTAWFMYSFYISLAYLTLLFAYHPLLRLDQFNRMGDYSYGLYIFGFPVQQSLVYVLGKPDPLLLFGLAFPLTLLLAIFSWHLIEKPSLKYKNKFHWREIYKLKWVVRTHQVYKSYLIAHPSARKLAIFVLSLVIIGSTANFAWRKIHVAQPSCQARGFIDAPKVIDPGSGGIEGWAADVAGIDRVELWANGKLLAGTPADIARPDVKAALPQCGFPVLSGYKFARGPIPPSATEVEIRAVNGDGKVFTLGHVPVDFSRPFGVLDVADPFEADGRNLISGWAIAAQGPVNIRVLAQDKEVLALTAGNRREDVGQAYPAWPQAASSGFEGLLPLRKLPRGRYSLKIVLEDGKGHSGEITGPEVRNDLPFGKVLAQQEKLMPPGNIELRAWLADEDGIRAAQVETETGTPLGEMQKVKEKQPLAAFPDPRFDRDKAGGAPLKQGDLYSLHVPFTALPPGLQRLQVRAEDKAGNVAVLPGPLVLDRNPAARQACSGDKLRVFYPGGAVNFRKNFPQLQELRDMAQGGCVEVGFRGRLEYLRTTRGRQADYVFDPDFPERLRKRNGKEMSGDSLHELLQAALHFHAPLMITLDGGVWADAKFAAPDLDIVDMLEQDERAVQWNQFGKAEPDDALKGLAGATDSPELARMMSLNIYNRRFLDYKKRNLQAAVREIVRFSRAHPDNFVMVNLDPDEYINPWFYLTQWYDYNPDTLRQYREWLFHLGPYADGGELAFSRHEPAMTLDEASRLAKRSWQKINAVEPPRETIDYSDPWQQLWTQFKRHLVARHYDDLAAWAVEAGLPQDRIYTSQTFIQADVAVSVTDSADGWTDQAGVSIEGAKPRSGHLGAILYGPSSRNEGKPRSGSSLIGDIRNADPDWGAVEFHPATISFPEKLPSHAQAYATLLALIDGGARFISPMWGSHAGDRVVHPDKFKSYDAMEGTPFEYQLVWWLRAMQARPVGSLYYPFGDPLVKSTDGWTAKAGTHLESDYGNLRLSGAGSQLELQSPRGRMRGLDAPTELVVSGDWPQAARLSAEMESDSGNKLSCTLRRTSAQEARCTFPPASNRWMSHLELHWQFAGGQARATVRSVALEDAVKAAHD